MGAKCLPPRYLAQAGDRPATFLQFEAFTRLLGSRAAGLLLATTPYAASLTQSARSQPGHDPAKRGDGVAAFGRTKNPKITADPGCEFFHGLAERGHKPLLQKVSGTVRFDLADGAPSSTGT